MGFRARISRGFQTASDFAFSPITSRLDRTNQVVENTGEALAGAAQSVSEVSGKMSGLLDAVHETTNQIFESIKGVVGNLPNVNQLFNAILHFVHVWISPSVKTIGVSIAGILTSLGLIPYELLGKISSQLGDLIGLHWGGDSTEVPSESPSNVQSLSAPPRPSDEEWFSFASLIFSSVCSLLGVVFSARSLDIRTLMGGFFKDLPRTWTMTTHVTSFLKATIGYFKRCFDWLKSTEPTVAGVENMFRDENYIPNFVKEAQLMLNSLNSEAVTTQVGLRSRFWSCVVQAYHIQNVVIAKELKPPVELMKLVNSVIQCSKEKAVQLMGCPVRYEPFVVHLVGASNIGKSFISQRFIVDVLKTMGVTSHDQPVFIRTPGNEYWNGCSAQPAVMYDDWLAVKGDKFGKVQIAELFALKTTATFNPLRRLPKLIALCRLRHSGLQILGT